MGEEHGPLPCLPLVKLDRSFGRLGDEVGGLVSQADGHDTSSTVKRGVVSPERKAARDVVAGR
jgi:hypothetical protein